MLLQLFDYQYREYMKKRKEKKKSMKNIAIFNAIFDNIEYRPKSVVTCRLCLNEMK